MRSARVGAPGSRGAYAERHQRTGIAAGTAIVSGPLPQPPGRARRYRHELFYSRRASPARPRTRRRRLRTANYFRTRLKNSPSASFPRPSTPLSISESCAWRRHPSRALCAKDGRPQEPPWALKSQAESALVRTSHNLRKPVPPVSKLTSVLSLKFASQMHCHPEQFDSRRELGQE